MEQVKLSVIIPVYNVKHFLRKCLVSVQRQTLQEMEVLLVDDGSTDGSGEICDEFAAKDKRFHVWHKENGGQTSARNLGLRMANAKVVGFVDSDDWIEPQMYQEMLRQMEETGASIVTSIPYLCNDAYQYKAQSGIEPGIYEEGSSKDIIIQNLIYAKEGKENGITPYLWDKIYDKELLMTYQFQIDEKIRYGEDECCVCACMIHANKVLVTHHSYCYHRQRENSVSRSVDKDYFEQITFLYRQMRRFFDVHENADILNRQLDKYILGIIMGAINQKFGFGYGILFPFHRMSDWLQQKCIGKEIILYGAGHVGENYYEYIRSTGICNVVLWVDKKWEHYQKRKMPVHDVGSIRKYKGMPVLIAVLDSMIADAIKGELIQMGIEENLIYYDRPKKFSEYLYDRDKNGIYGEIKNAAEGKGERKEH